MEYFPRIGCFVPHEGYDQRRPRITKWCSPQSVNGAKLTFRHYLETIRTNQVVWEPFADHREHWPFAEIALYSGYIRCGKIRRPYLLERVFRQFGYIHNIPRPPPAVPTYDELVEQWAQWGMHVVHGDPVTIPGECRSNYIDWVHYYSHPYMLPTSI